MIDATTFHVAAALGAVLGLAGLVLAAHAAVAAKTERARRVPWIAATAAGLALFASGAGLIAQSASGLKQRDALRAALERLGRSEEMLVAFVTPSVLPEPAFREYLVSASPELREAVVRRAMGLLKAELARVTDAKRAAYAEGDFTTVRAIVEFLLADDPKNGSALFYRGEMSRLLKQPLAMRASFDAYLGQAPAPGGRLPGVKGQQYFDERTAWVHHLLANDYLCEALQTASGRPDLKMVLAEVEIVRKYHRDGFEARDAALSTEMLEKAALKGAGAVARPRCAPRSPRED